MKKRFLRNFNRRPKWHINHDLQGEFSKMKREIIIELERVTIIEQKSLNQDSSEDEEDDAIEVEAKEIIETEKRATPED